MTNERQPPLFSQPAQNHPQSRPAYSPAAQPAGATIALGQPMQNPPIVSAADPAPDDGRAMRIPVRDRAPPAADDRLMDYAADAAEYDHEPFGPEDGRRGLAGRVRAATQSSFSAVSRRFTENARYGSEQTRTYLNAMPKQHAVAGTLVLLLGGMIGFALGQWSGPSAVAATATSKQTAEQQRPIIQQSALKSEDMTPPLSDVDKAKPPVVNANKPQVDKTATDKAPIDKQPVAQPKADPRPDPRPDPRKDPIKLEAAKPESKPDFKPEPKKDKARVDEPKSRTNVDAGQPAWRKYAASAVVEPAGRPMIAIIVDDLGSDPKRTARVAKISAPMTLALSAKGKELDVQAAMARKAGHELLALVPMEPTNASVDAGPRALMVKQSNDEIRKNLDWHLSRFNGFVGVSNHMGSKFTADSARMSVVMGDARKRGVLFVDAVTTGKSTGQATALKAGVPYLARDVFLEAGKQPASADAQFKRLEDVARKRGYAVAIARADDATLAALQAWLPEAKKRGMVFVPISALVPAQASARQSASKD